MKHKKPSTDWWRLTLDHLAGGVVTFVAGRSIKQPMHLTIKVHGPDLRFAPDVVASSTTETVSPCTVSDCRHKATAMSDSDSATVLRSAST